MEHSTESEEDEYAFVVNVKKLEAENGSETVDLLLGGVVVRNVVLDSGSSCNIVDQKTWEELKSNSIKCKSEKSTQKLYPYGLSKPLETLEKFEAVENVAGKEITAEFIVICKVGRPILGRKTATELDLKWGYHQLKQRGDSRGITTFTTHTSLYRYKRLMFGITSTPEIYQHALQQALHGCEGGRNII